MTADKIMVLDLETQNNPYYGAVASPRHPDNYVVMVGQAIEATPYSGEIRGQYFHNKEEAENWLEIPDDVWLIVAHNAPYEVDWMLTQQREKFLAFLKRGGRVFDTALGHYLLSNQQDTYPPLDEIAPIYGGSHKVDGVKILWDQGTLTADIDPALLSEYLLGPEGDIENTRKVFYGIVQQAQERGMWEMMLDRMEGQLALGFMMNSGLKVDREAAFRERDKLAEDVEALSKKFQALREGFPEGLEFKETSKHHMSAWVYGGPIKYRARVPALNDDGTPQYVKVDCYKFEDDAGKPTYVRVDQVPTPEVFASCVAAYGSADRYKAGKNKGNPKVHKVESGEVKTKWGEELHQCPGLVNLQELSSDFRTDFIHENTGKLALADESPVISTGADALKAVAAQRGVSDEARDAIQGLLEYFLKRKDLSTYYLIEERDDDGNVVSQSGALKYLTPEDLIHHVLNTTSTATTRLSSNNPNFQNLPRGDDNGLYQSRVKAMFVSRFGDDGYIVGPDYTALEVVGLACFSQDKALCEALVNGTDMHCLRLAAKLGEPYEEVLRKCKDESHPDHAFYKKERTDIKPPSFAYQYGATARGISYATGMPLEEAEAFIEREKALFPDVERFYEAEVYPQVELNVKQHREQTPDGGWRVYGTGVWVSPAGTTYQFRQFPKTDWVNGQKISTMQFKPTQMRNYPIQGESSFFVQVICGLLMRWLVQNDFFGGRVHMINTVHDAIYFDIHKDVMAEVCPQIQKIMESIPQALSKYPGYHFPVPFPVSVEYGKNMQDMTHFKLEDFQ